MEELSFNDVPYPRLFLNSLYDMQQSNYMCDITLTVGEEKIQAHKIVLHAVSPYFRAMESAGLRESVENQIQFHDISFDILTDIVGFMYTGEIKVNENIVYELMAASHLLCIMLIKPAISHFILNSLNSSNSLEALAYAKLYNYEELASDILNYILDNFHFVVSNKAYLEASQDVVQLVLCNDALNINDACKALDKWVAHSSCTLEFSLQDRQIVSSMARFLDYLSEVGAKNSHFVELLDNFREFLNRRCAEGNVYVGHTEYDHRAEVQILMAIGGRSTGGGCPSSECYISSKWSMFIPGVAYNSTENSSDTDQLIPAMSIDKMSFACASRKYDVFVVGGCTDNQQQQQHLCNTCERYNIKDNEWTLLCPLPVVGGLRNAAATFVSNVLIVTGGAGACGQMSTLSWQYREKEDRWKAMAGMQQPRAGHTVCNVRGVLYALAGTSTLGSVERYDDSLARWTYMRAMPEPRTLHGSVAYQHFIYVIGGKHNHRVLNSVYKYNTLSDDWERCADMLLPKYGFGCTVKNDRIFCVGGRDTVHGTLPSVEFYNPQTNRWHYLHAKLSVPRTHLSAVTLHIATVPNN